MYEWIVGGYICFMFSLTRLMLPILVLLFRTFITLGFIGLKVAGEYDNNNIIGNSLWIFSKVERGLSLVTPSLIGL